MRPDPMHDPMHIKSEFQKLKIENQRLNDLGEDSSSGKKIA